jgi:hypothetical protein
MSDLAARLDAIGVDAELDAEDLLVSAVCVLSVLVPGDNRPRLVLANSEGLSWIEQAGLLRLAERICSGPVDLEGDEDG